MSTSDRKAALLARRGELIGNIEKIGNELDDPVDKDWEEAASERQGDEVLVALGSHDQAEIRRIDAALQRIEDGEYGYCVICGEEIEPARLDLLPDTPFCARHAR